MGWGLSWRSDRGNGASRKSQVASRGPNIPSLFKGAETGVRKASLAPSKRVECANSTLRARRGKNAQLRTGLVERDNPHPSLPPEKGKEPFGLGFKGYGLGALKTRVQTASRGALPEEDRCTRLFGEPIP
ncbi:hypothetical protein GCM10027046_25220 [Uliginosibacterium flavum]